MPHAPRALVALLVLLYVAATVLVLVHSGRHELLALVAAQYLFLLPAVVLHLRVNMETASTAGGERSAARWLHPGVLYTLYVLAVLALAWCVQGRVPTGDETAYRFQSRIFLSGHMTVEAPPRASAERKQYLKEFRYHHHIIHHGRWFTKYFPGWPALLAAGGLLNADWLMNPLLGLVILWLTYRIARMTFEESVARSALFFMVVSPFFALNCMGFMSHPSCGALIAAATLFYLRGLRSHRLTDFAAMFFLVLLAGLIRPQSAFFAAVPLGFGALWHLRRAPSRMVSLAILAVGLGATGVAILLLYNRALSGAFWPLTFALYSGTFYPKEVVLLRLNLLRVFLVIMRWSIQTTLIYVFPFLFLLAAYAVITPARKRPGACMLAALAFATFAGRIFPPGPSGSLYGERLYFETFFAIAILGAAGWAALKNRWRLSTFSARPVIVLLVAAQLLCWSVFSPEAYSNMKPFVRVEAAVRNLRLTDTLVCLKTGFGFAARDLNLNDPDWKRAPAFYIPDPGPGRRHALACRLGKTRWIVVSYDEVSGSARIEEDVRGLRCQPL